MIFVKLEKEQKIFDKMFGSFKNYSYLCNVERKNMDVV